MSDEATMRLRLQRVAAYRELCRSVQRSGRENVIFAVIMGALGYYLHTQGRGDITIILYTVIAVGELCIGLFKWLFPSANGLLLDGVVLLVFAGLNGWLAYQTFRLVGRPDTVYVFLGLFMLYGSFNRFRSYGDLRRLFADRPDPEHVAWFNGLVYEIRASDPTTDQLALDLPTRPHWKAKLLGSTAFFVATDGNAVWIAGPDEFTLRREKADRGHGSRKALLNIHGEGYPEFDLGDESWTNYTNWIAAQTPLPPA